MKILKLRTVKISLVSLILISGLLGLMSPALAADNWLKSLGFTLIPEACTNPCTDINQGCAEPNNSPTGCGLNAMLQVVINISKIILALTGSAALLMFVYGGLMFIIAAGSTEKISKAKEILKTAVIGLVIIFSSWLIINGLIGALTKGEVTGGVIFTKDWFKSP